MAASTITGTTITVNGTTFTQTSEVGGATYVDVASESSKPYRLKLSHNQSTKKNSARNSIITVSRVVPFTTASGGVVQETLSVQFALRQVPDYLYADKTAEIGTIVATLAALIADANVMSNLIAGVSDLKGSTATA
jgi:hypothetical protein